MALGGEDGVLRNSTFLPAAGPDIVFYASLWTKCYAVCSSVSLADVVAGVAAGAA
jgi:hypothetical protein